MNTKEHAETHVHIGTPEMCTQSQGLNTGLYRTFRDQELEDTPRSTNVPTHTHGGTHM